MDISELSIVVVEPSHAQWRIIEKSLKEQGVANCNWFREGTMALEALQRLMPDLVVSAMYLPDMTGVDLVHKIREDQRLSEVMFMLISSETDDHYLEPIRQAGVVATLPKPFDPKDLRRALYATLDYVDPDAHEEDYGGLEDMRVLLVDDSHISREMLRRVLVKMGIENISEAEDGNQAIQQLESEYFDFVVTDLNMPGLDGRELVRYIRASDTLSAIPVLMVTSESDQSRLAAVHQEGVSALCDKPVEPSTFMSMIKGLLSV
jgi:two-component system chemotaxis response regulator CheY